MTSQDPAVAVGEEVQVDVWHAAAATEELGRWESACERLLPSEEIRNADRFRRTTTRNQHVVGRAMARRLLGDTRVAPEAVQFGIGEHGKPFVLGPPEAQQPFNVAHTDGLVLCGIADDRVELVGVDVEAVNRKTSTELAERYFSAPEVRYLRSRPLSQQKHCFLKIWTLKEAFIKAIGTGLQTPLSDFAFDHLDSHQPSIRFLSDDLHDGRQWKFECFEPRDGFIAAAAIVPKLPSTKPLIHWQPFEPLVPVK